jgi:hypothetical protein
MAAPDCPPLGAPDNDVDAALMRWFAQRCHAASKQQRALVFAVERGADTDVDCIRLELDRRAAQAPDTCFYSSELATLLPHAAPTCDDDEGRCGFPYVPTEGSMPNADDLSQRTLADWEWALRMGYARDRVVAYGRVKAAMLRVHNIDATPEMQRTLFDVYDVVRHELQAVERSLAQSTGQQRMLPEAMHKTLRERYALQAAHVGEAQMQQPTLRQTPVVLGHTMREITALSIDPLASREFTRRVGRIERENALWRDRDIGRETFFSFVFPNEAHEVMMAAAATGTGIESSDATPPRYPALVTMHHVTGCVRCFAEPANGGAAPNAFVTHDAAALMFAMHQVCVDANVSLDEKWERNYLLLDHELL